MRGAWRVIVADLWWILSGMRALVLLVLLPALVLLLVGQLRARVQEYSLGIAGRPAAAKAARQLDEGVQLWQQLSALRVVRFESAAIDPREVLKEQQLDLLLNVDDAGSGCWRIYSRETNPARAAAVRQVAASLERSLLLAAARRDEPSAALCEPIEDELELASSSEEPESDRNTGGQVSAALVGFGVLPPAMLSTYHPAALDRRLAMLPMTIALVLCFLPFVVAVSSLIKEKEGHTLEILLSAPNIDGRGLFVAKALLPVLLAAFNFAMMVVLVDTLFGLHTKGSMGGALLAILPGLLSASLLGVAASTMVASQTQAVMASALYFVALTLLTGFVTPLAEASSVVRATSRFLPLSFVMPTLDAWFFGAGPQLPGGAAWLLVQVATSATLAVVAFRRFLRRL